MISPEQIPRETGGIPIPTVGFDEDPKEFLATKIHTDKVNRWLRGAEWFDVFSKPNGASIGDFEVQYETLMRIGRCNDGEHILIETVGDGPTGKWQTLIIQKRFPGNEGSSIEGNFVLDKATSRYVKTGQEEA